MSKIEIRNLTKSYRLGHTSVEALRGIDLSIDTPEIIGIVGPSGSGKTTLLNILGGIDLATSGTVSIDEEKIGDLDDNARTALRRREIGFIFQTFSLIPVLTALENVELPLMAQGVPKKERRERALALLKRVGLTREAYQRPDELSGGQRQRVAIARALIIKPRLVLADEPTANLDGENGRNPKVPSVASQASRASTEATTTTDSSLIEEVLHKVSPDVVFLNYYDDVHQDHRAAAQAGISASRYVKEVLFYEVPTTQHFDPNIFVDIMDVLEKKIELIKKHASQVDRTRVNNLTIVESVQSCANFRGYQGRVKFAEGFNALRLLRPI